MKIGYLRTVIEGLSDDTQVVVIYYDKSEADEDIENNLSEDFKESDKLSDEEWNLIVEKMNGDDGIWQEVSESFRYYTQQALDNRKKGKK